jgi:hypothetical protein
MGSASLAEGETVSVARCCFAARSDRLPLACLLGLLLAVLALFVLPPLALAYVCSGDDAALCQAQDAPGKHLCLVAGLDLCHGLAPCDGAGRPAPVCSFAALPSGEPTPQGLAFTLALVGRPPPLGA